MYRACTAHVPRMYRACTIGILIYTRVSYLVREQIVLNFLKDPLSLHEISLCFSNYRACSCLVMRSLNPARFSLLLRHWFNDHVVQGPEEINSVEPFVLGL